MSAVTDRAPTARRRGWVLSALGVLVVTGLAVALAVGLAPGRPAAPTEGAPAPATTGREASPEGVSSPREDVPSALDDMSDPALPEPLIDPAAVRSGGPPPDGIPALDEPRFVGVDEVDFLDDTESVLLLSLDGDVRVYPVQVLTWHEIVNDVVGGTPVTVTYCPLCNSALAFERTVGERVLDFGTSGRLYRSNLVMYDRQTESLWPQAEGRAVAGVLTGTELARVPVALLPWQRVLADFPDAQVLSRETGFSRDYGRNPYVGYDDEAAQPFLFDGEVDPRLPAMRRVVGVGEPGDPVAVTTARLVEVGVVEVEVAGEPVVLLGTAGQASALDAPEVAGGADVGTTGAFSPVLDGRRLTLAPGVAPGVFVDDETGSEWDVTGRARAGELAGAQLDRRPSTDTFWFSWQSFWPGTRLQDG